jgi:rubrerythrin
MSKETRMNILKGALLLEYKGKALFDSVAGNTEIEEVKELFRILAHEEENHIAMLNKQLVRLIKGGKLDETSSSEELPPSTAEAVLTQTIVDRVHGAGYEAAVISAALDFEKKAVKFYTEQSAVAETEEEKHLYEWLKRWETGHMQMLAEMDEGLKEKIWYDNQFWPLD